METSAEACWRLSKACGQWAVESRDSAARIAFRQMATAWARLAFNEEFAPPVVERIDLPTSENSEATPVEILAASLLIPSSENAPPEVERDWTKPHNRLSFLSSEPKCNTPADLIIGTVDQDLRECCHAMLFAFVG